MKILPVLILLAFSTFVSAAVSLDDIVNLSKSKASDEVILRLIEKEGIARPVTSKDVIFLKQQGVSDRVVQYLVKLSSIEQPVGTEKNLRSYYTTNKTGKRIRVVTNLDESGKRMGGEIPPDPSPVVPETAAYRPEPPQEIRIVVENDSRREDPYIEEYVDDRYAMPDSFYSPYTPYYPYYPGYPLYPNHGGRHHRGGDHFFDRNKPHWRYDYSKTLPIVRPQRRHQQTTAPKSPSAGTRKSIRPIR
jgi:hypothetical protein